MNKTMQIDKVNKPITPEPHDRSATSLEQRGGESAGKAKWVGGKVYQVTLNMGLMPLATWQ